MRATKEQARELLALICQLGSGPGAVQGAYRLLPKLRHFIAICEKVLPSDKELLRAQSKSRRAGQRRRAGEAGGKRAAPQEGG